MLTQAGNSAIPIQVPIVNQAPWPEYPTEPTTVQLVAHERTWQASLVHETFGAMALIVSDEIAIGEGEPITVVHHDVELRGHAWSVLPDGPRQTRVGVRWWVRGDLTVRRPSALSETAHFLSVGQGQVACRPLKIVEGRVDVRLPDGSQRVVPSFELDLFTRTERRRELERLESELTVLSAFYGLGVMETECQAIRAILNVEFAKSWNDV